MEKFKIIEAIAFYMTYPTYESYRRLTKQELDKTIGYNEGFHKNLYESRVNLAKVGVANGFVNGL